MHNIQGELMRNHRDAHGDLSLEAYAYMMLLHAVDKCDCFLRFESQRNPKREDISKAKDARIQHQESQDTVEGLRLSIEPDKQLHKAVNRPTILA